MSAITDQALAEARERLLDQVRHAMSDPDMAMIVGDSHHATMAISMAAAHVLAALRQQDSAELYGSAGVLAGIAAALALQVC